ncbi:MAG TPA: ring-cleaving dioxygenase [Saprospiraceae bacterium]|nr:ring-cleaving dioxygenase [Saprospiraceae bacterium]
MSLPLINGLHHVTAMARDPQENVNFYAGILGLRLVKKTINFDAPDVYHLYYGDENGRPGSIMTFFPWQHMKRGSQGIGQTKATTFSIPSQAVDYWIKRLQHFEIPHQSPKQRFGQTVISLQDFDSLPLELITDDEDQRAPFSYGQIPLEYAIRGFHSVELMETEYEATESVLVNLLDHEFVAEEGSRRRYAPKNVQNGQFVDIIFDANSGRARGGSGTVHHVAFETASDEDQLAVRERLLRGGLSPTQVLDRQYFHSIYFREPGGVLFEVATTPPGFTFDEKLEDLGQGLKLPPWMEQRREYLEKLLAPIELNPMQFASKH